MTARATRAPAALTPIVVVVVVGGGALLAAVAPVSAQPEAQAQPQPQPEAKTEPEASEPAGSSIDPALPETPRPETLAPQPMPELAPAAEMPVAAPTRSSPALAGADPALDSCYGLLLEPVDISLRDTGFDQPRSACGQRTLRVQSRGAALVDRPEFYGTLTGSLFVGLRYQEHNAYEWEVAARLGDFRYAQNASVAEDEFSFGPVFFGAGFLFRGQIFGRRIIYSPRLRFSVPLTNDGYEVVTASAVAGVSAALELSPRTLLHGRGALLIWGATATGGMTGRMAGAVSSELARALGTRFGIVAGTEVQVGWYGFGLDHLLVRGGMRARLSTTYRLDVGVSVPVLGTERTNIAAQLGVSREL